MNKFAKVIFLTGLAVFLLAGICTAAPFTFSVTDTRIFWPGYENLTGDDTNEDIGRPEIETITVVGTHDEANNKFYLNTITIAGTRFGILKGEFDSLFLDTNAADTEWDHYVRTNYDGSGNETWDFYTVNSGVSWAEADAKPYGVSNDPYERVPAANTGSREKHPNGIKSNFLTSTTGVSVDAHFNTHIVYDFGAGASGLELLADLQPGKTGSFNIGYTPFCANDVVLLSKELHKETVPEPANMMLLGSGLIGLAAIGRKRFKR